MNLQERTREKPFKGCTECGGDFCQTNSVRPMRNAYKALLIVSVTLMLLMALSIPQSVCEASAVVPPKFEARKIAVYQTGTNIVLPEVHDGDSVDIVIEFTKPDTPEVASMNVWVRNGGFSDKSIEYTALFSGNSVRVRFVDLAFDGSSRNLNLFLSGTYNNGNSNFSQDIAVSIREAVVTSGESDAIPPSGTADPPKIVVDTSARFSTAMAGKTYKLEIPIKNTGKQSAKEISISIEPGDDKEFPFEYDKYAFTASLPELDAGAVQKVTLTLKTLPTARNGQNTIVVKFSCKPSVGGAAIDSSESIAVKIENNNTTPKLVVENIDVGGTNVIPGNNFSLKISLKNLGTLTAKNVKMTLKGLKPDGIVTNNEADIKYIGDIRGRFGSTEKFNLKAAEKLTGENAELTLALSYIDETGKEYTDESAIFIPLVGGNTSEYAAVEFLNLKAPTETLTEGNNFTVSFDLKNIGDVYIEEIKLTYTIGAELIGKSLNTRMLKPIAPQDSVPLSYVFSVSKALTTGNFPIAFTVEYLPKDNKAESTKITATQYVGIQLFKPEEEKEEEENKKDSVPKIIVSNYSYEPKEAKAGQTVDVTLTFFNTSAVEQVKNITIQMDSTSAETANSTPGSIFTPVEGSNTFYIETIAPRSSAEKTIKLYIKADVEPKSYPLYANIDYEDSKSTAITAKESISIPVSQITKLMIGDIMLGSPEAFIGQGANISLEFINMGKTTLYNVMVTTEGPFDTQAQSYYAGNIQSGGSDYYDGMVVPMEPGSQTGCVVITYEDAAGIQYEEKREFVLEVIDMNMRDPGMWDPNGMGEGDFEMLPPMEEETGFKALLNKFLKPIPIAITAGVLLAGTITTIVLLKRRKRRKLEEGLDDDEDL